MSPQKLDRIIKVLENVAIIYLIIAVVIAWIR